MRWWRHWCAGLRKMRISGGTRETSYNLFTAHKKCNHNSGDLAVGEGLARLVALILERREHVVWL